MAAAQKKNLLLYVPAHLLLPRTLITMPVHDGNHRRGCVTVSSRVPSWFSSKAEGRLQGSMAQPFNGFEPWYTNLVFQMDL